jgi:hypothetical protein
MTAMALAPGVFTDHISVAEPAGTFVGSSPGGFLPSLPLPRSLYVGADVNPVRTQLADYFAVRSGTGLLVKSVDAGKPKKK